MGKKVDTIVLDGALDILATATRIDVLVAEPADRNAAVSGSLATAVLAGGDFTKAAGDVSGRKVTIAAKPDLTITASGTAGHVAISSATTLLLVATTSSQVLTAGGGAKVSLPTWKYEITNPA